MISQQKQWIAWLGIISCLAGGFARAHADTDPRLKQALAEASKYWFFDEKPAVTRHDPSQLGRVRFIDEIGKPSSKGDRKRHDLYYLTLLNNVTPKDSYDPGSTDAKIHLYEIGDFSSELQSSFEVATIENPLVSPYYIRQIGKNNMAYLSRWDKPDLLIPADINEGWYGGNEKVFPEYWRWFKRKKTELHDMLATRPSFHMVLHGPKPTELAPGVISPFTGVLNPIGPKSQSWEAPNWIVVGHDFLEENFAKEAAATAEQKLNRLFSTREVELMIAMADPPHSTWLAQWERYAWALGALQSGDAWQEKQLTQYVEELRPTLKKKAQELLDTLLNAKGGTDEPQQFHPVESRLVSLRLRRAGQERERKALSRVESLGALDDEAAQKKQLRGFIWFMRPLALAVLNDVVTQSPRSLDTKSVEAQIAMNQQDVKFTEEFLDGLSKVPDLSAVPPPEKQKSGIKLNNSSAPTQPVFE